jgi:hypothetical protein
MSLFERINPINKIKNDLGKVIGNKIGDAIQQFFVEYKDHLESVKKEVLYAFERDHDLIGRILKCHLILETFMDKCIKHLNKDQLSTENTSLRFIQKVEMIEDKLDEMKTYFKGIRSLNTIRNKLAHNLHAEVTIQDVQSMKIYAEMYKREKINDPIKIIEEFTLVACALLLNETSEKFGDLSKIYAVCAKSLEMNSEEYENYFK